MTSSPAVADARTLPGFITIEFEALHAAALALPVPAEALEPFRVGQGDATPPSLMSVTDALLAAPTLAVHLLRHSTRDGQQAPMSLAALAWAFDPMTLASFVGGVRTIPLAEWPAGAYGIGVLVRLRRAVMLARAAETLAAPLAPAQTDAAALVGLIADFGQDVLEAAAPAHTPRRPRGAGITQWEGVTFAITHAELGASLCRRWRIREEVARAIEDHHAPDPPDDALSRTVWAAARVVEAIDEEHVAAAWATDALTAVGLDERWLARVLRRTTGLSCEPTAATPSPLTKRQLEIFRLFAAGYEIDEVSRRLDVSPSTVNNHTWRAYRTLCVANRSQALFFLHQQGWL